jgi:hypothetical protein
VITKVPLDSFQIYINNSSYIKMIYRNGDTTVIASPDLSGRSNPVEGHGIATHLSGARNDIKEGLRMTGKIVSGFMCLTMER